MAIGDKFEMEIRSTYDGVIVSNSMYYDQIAADIVGEPIEQSLAEAWFGLGANLPPSPYSVLSPFIVTEFAFQCVLIQRVSSPVGPTFTYILPGLTGADGSSNGLPSQITLAMNQTALRNPVVPKRRNRFFLTGIGRESVTRGAPSNTLAQGLRNAGQAMTSIGNAGLPVDTYRFRLQCATSIGPEALQFDDSTAPIPASFVSRIPGRRTAIC